MKQGFDEKGLADFIDTYLARKYDRLLNRFFVGTVTIVTQVGSGFQVQVKRTGETAADGNTYMVAPGYFPQVGDKVECEWRDNASGYVLWPLAIVGGYPNTSAVKLFETVIAAGVQLPSVTWTGIPGSYRNLRLETVGRSDAAVSATDLGLQFNGDTGFNYDWGGLDAGAGIAPTQFSSIGSSYLRLGTVPGANSGAGLFNISSVSVPAYADTLIRKAVTSTCWRNEAGLAASVEVVGGAWRNTNAVTSMHLFPVSGNFTAGCSFTLYGLP